MFKNLDMCAPKYVKGAHPPRNEHPWVETIIAVSERSAISSMLYLSQTQINLNLAKINCKQVSLSVILNFI